jgi:hypothetical protein
MNIFSNILIITDKILEKRCHIFWNKHKNFILKNNRGYGYWLWKSFIILKTLESIDEEDIIVYADSGCSLNINGLNRLNEYFDIVKNSKYGILTFETPFIEKQYTKRDVFDHMKLLETLDLSGNNLSGPLPDTMSNLVNLKYLKLQSNNLSGLIPLWAEQLVSLKEVNLSKRKILSHSTKDLKRCVIIIIVITIDITIVGIIMIVGALIGDWCSAPAMVGTACALIEHGVGFHRRCSPAFLWENDEHQV